jgi:hypothetical protein
VEFLNRILTKKICLNDINVLSLYPKSNIMVKEIQFYIDDVSDDVTLETLNGDSVENSQFYEELVNKIRSQKWFIEGNKTEGVITFHSDFDISIDWMSITMGKDWDSDIEESHSQDCIINPDTTTFKTIEF